MPKSFKEKIWPEWNFEKHCTNILPEKVHTMEDLGHENDKTFAITAPFCVLTDEAIQIARDIILHDEKVRKHCKFNACDHEMTDNSYAFRNICGINNFFQGMLTCPKFEDYLQRSCHTKEISLWDISWLKGHANVQEGKESQEIPNVAWHYDKAMFAMLINISEMPENPKGGGTLAKTKDGKIIPFVYTKPGDSVIIRGSRVQHCGLGAENYNKIILAPGLGNNDVRVPDTNNDFNKMHWDNSDPIDFMKQWTGHRLRRIEAQLEILKSNPNDRELLENMLLENKCMKDGFELFYGGITPKDSPWIR